ncbi:ABC transporter ATP-binding protein [Hippea maritima]|uniref:Oligopeptide/dipeptide ABC transporter, ATPase subunit n=1 Tax=Hippea maritima (strain ATCC 700847 / DSM 10411 / MH2) TaxID=760142 RepID=F2LXA7_HIPMA|nr:ABC transporter ATP-binding protein [Hippea maritima]AEA34221.1 oligopeptide/dipeptide ABC transporter, ATPase subunit [Hippea maritima DSM 10411]
MALVEIKDLRIEYQTRSGNLSAVAGLNLNINEQESLGIVGESGCGKSTLGTAIMKLSPQNAKLTGQIIFEGKDILKLKSEDVRKIRGKDISMIFQDPMTSLNPIMRIRDHFFELFKVHYPKMTKEEMIKIASEALLSVGVDPSRLDNYPFEFSGGMRQRVMIAIAICLKPKLLIADEPTTSLDVVVQEQIMQVLKNLKKTKNMSIMLITHDMGIVAELAEKVAVMYAGWMVEYSTVLELYNKPLHPYTQLLLESIPNVKIDDMELKHIPGSLPDLKNPPKGCRFHPRCPFAKDICKKEEPPTVEIENRKVKCWLYGDKT